MLELVIGTQYFQPKDTNLTVAYNLRNRVVGPPPNQANLGPPQVGANPPHPPPPRAVGLQPQPQPPQPPPQPPVAPPRGGAMANLNRLQRQNADPAMLAILDRLAGDSRLTLLPKQSFTGTGKSYTSRDHWDEFQKYLNFQGFPQFADALRHFGMTLAGTAFQWFNNDIGNVRNVQELKHRFLKRFNVWGQTHKQWTKAWNELKYATGDDVDKFKLEVELLGNMLENTADQILEKYKESFPPYIESQLDGLDTLPEAHTKAKKLLQIFKSETDANPKACASVLDHKEVTTPTKVNTEAHENDHASYGKLHKQSQPNQKNADTRPKQYANNRGQGQRQNQQNYGNQYPQRRFNNQPQNNYGQNNYGQYNNQYPQGGFQGGRGNNYGGGYRGQRYQASRGRGRGMPRGRGLPMYQQQNRQFQNPTYDYQPQQAAGYNTRMQDNYKGVPQARWFCTLCGYKGHYDHQCQMATDFMSRAATALGYNPRALRRNAYDHTDEDDQRQNVPAIQAAGHTDENQEDQLF